MRVIKRVDLSGNWPQQFTCNGCTSTLEVSLTDIQFPVHTDSVAAPESWYVCPVCGGKTYLNSSDTQDIINLLSQQPGPPTPPVTPSGRTAP